jgi:hypothetical protein
LTDATNHYFQMNAIPGLITMANLVVWIVLLFRLVRNRETIGRPNATFNTAWAIAGPLVPLVSSVVPWLQMNELWKSAHPDDPPMNTSWKGRPASSVIYTWWGLVLGGQIVSLIGSVGVLSAMFSSIGDLNRGGDLVAVAEKLVDNNLKWFVAATLLTGVGNVVGGLGVRALVARQEQYATKWNLNTAAPTYFSGSFPGTYPGSFRGPVTPPAGWYPDPTGRHHHRWWDGSGWTTSVADNGVTTVDAL